MGVFSEKSGLIVPVHLRTRLTPIKTHPLATAYT
mgnify:CR=1 FL=1